MKRRTGCGYRSGHFKPHPPFAMAKLPAFQFYPADWRKDPNVQALDYYVRGVWFEILCLMHESEQRGKLLLNGRPMPDEALARLLGLDKQKLTSVLGILLDYGVASRDDQGALVNRRMVRDEEIRQIRSESGKKGGNPSLVKQNGSKAKYTANQKPTPSSSTPLTSSDKKRETTAPAKVSDFAAPVNPKRRNPLFSHPAIQALILATKQEPPIETWEYLASKLGEDVDVGKLKQAYAEWRVNGHRATNWEGITDWYLGKRHGKNQSNSKPTNVDRIEATKRTLNEFPTEAELAIARENDRDDERSG